MGGQVDAASASKLLWPHAEERLTPLALQALAHKPFPDVRCHAWHLLSALVPSRVAAQRMVTAEEIRDNLLDFTSESESQARIAKHAFIVSLVQEHGEWLGAFLEDNVEGLLTEYARQGPHWVPRQAG